MKFRLVLAGPAMPGFEGRLSLMSERGRVIDLPQLNEQERRDFFAAIDVFALPSYVESFGLSALEAAWCGAAVIAYDHGGPGEILSRRGQRPPRAGRGHRGPDSRPDSV